MKVFVCIKQVPDSEMKIKLKPDLSGVDTTGVKWVMNPYDEFAVEEAIKLREAGKATSVVVISVGPKARTSEALRTALAMGADEAIVVDAPEGLDSFVTAKALSGAIALEGDFKAILCGRLAIDGNSSAVCQMLAEFLGLPHATVISKIEWADSNATVEREIEGGSKEIIQVTLPAVIAANKGLNLPRYASVPGIMKAKKKVIKELELSSLNISIESAKIKISNFVLPPEKPPVKIVTGDSKQQVTTLVDLLRNEAKVL